MEGNLSKALWLGVTILLFIAVVTVGISIFSGMKDVSSMANTQVGAITQSMTEEEFRMYDGKEVKGDDVLSAINSYSGRSGEIIILVSTLGKGKTSVNLDLTTSSSVNISSFTPYISDTSGSLSVDERCIILSSTDDALLKSKSKNLVDAARRDCESPNMISKYINPSGKFMAQLIYDSNLKIRGIAFAQKG